MRVKRDLSVRRHAFQLYIKTGNVSEVARQLNLKRHTVYAWSLEDRWDERLAEIQQKLQVHLDSVRRFEDNAVLRLYFQELQFLDYLQEQVSEKFITGEIQPTTWKELMDTQKFILERRERLLGLMSDPTAKKNIDFAIKETERISAEDAARHLQSSVTPARELPGVTNTEATSTRKS